MWIDVSVPVRPGMAVWPGDPGVGVTLRNSFAQGDIFNLTAIAMSAHTGTHMDAPRHFIDGAAGMETLPLDAVLGEVRVIEIADPVAVRVAELEPLNLQPGERILLRTRNTTRRWRDLPFFEDYVYISKEAAAHIVERGVRTVGIDYLSVGGFHQDLVETHLVLLGAGIWVIEGLDLENAPAGRYEMACLPLHLLGADGAPARVALRPLGA